jgi:hypothetical protein
MTKDKGKGGTGSGKPKKVTRPVLFRSLEGKGTHVLNSEETKDAQGKRVIKLTKTKPGNSNN